MVEAWKNLKELSVEEEKELCTFDIRRERQISEDGGYISRYQAVSAKLNGNEVYEVLSEVPAKRHFILYPEAIDYLGDQLAGLGVESKLFHSSLEPAGKALFQQYCLNLEITTPDKTRVSPMVIMRAAYYGPRPALEFHFGAYRFVCSNGAITSYSGVKESYRSINTQNWNGLRNFSIGEWLKRSLERMEAVSAFYKKMHNTSLLDRHKEIFSEKSMPVPLRKSVLTALETVGKVEVTVESHRKRQPPLNSVLLKDIHLEEENIDGFVHFVGDESLWTVYNNFTNSATFNSRSSAKFITDSQHINEIFSKSVA